MFARSSETHGTSEEFLARLTAAAYEVFLQHGLKVPFLEVELDLWRQLREVLNTEHSPTAAVPA